MKAAASRKVKAGARGASLKLDRTEIVSKGLELARSMSLHDISIVQVAREFDVTPASIHYHLDGRESLRTGILNRFVAGLLEDWPALAGDWRDDLLAVAKTIYAHYAAYPGIAHHFVSANRYEVLTPNLEPGAIDVQMRYIDQYFAVVGAAGLSTERTMSFAIVLINFIHWCAHTSASHQWPGEQSGLTAYLEKVDPAAFPHLARYRQAYLGFRGEKAFKEGVEIILSGMAAERGSLNPQP
jgi:AcrR family transcriptional regulator